MNIQVEKHKEKLMSYISNNKIEQALDYVFEMEEEERNNWEIQNIIGIILTYCREYEKAAEYFRIALSENENDPNIYYNLANVYFKMKKYNQAEVLLNLAEYNAYDSELKTDIEFLKNNINSEEIVDYKNNVLMIAYYFPPLSGSGVYRSLKFAKYLKEFGWNPTVISATEPPIGWNFRDESLINEIDGLNVLRISDTISTEEQNYLESSEVQRLLSFLKNIFQHDDQAMKILNYFLDDKELTKHLLTFPCGALKWAVDVTDYIDNNIEKLQDKMEIVYTTSGPYSSHLVGFYLKKKYNIRWIADYRDPWTNNPYFDFDKHNIRHLLLYKLEEILLKHADMNITVGKNLIRDYINTFGLSRDKIISINNGFDRKDFQDLKVNKERNDKFILVHSGIMYSKYRSMKPIFKALGELIKEGKILIDNVCIKIIGECDKKENIELAKQYNIENIIEFTGYLSHKEALYNNINSDMLLLLVGDDEKNKNTYTGKLYDYLGSNKPILAIATKNGVVDNILRETEHGKAFNSDQILEIKEEILKKYTDWMNGIGNVEMSSKIKIYERRYLTMKLVDCFYLVKNNSTNFIEISSEIYNNGYKLGGASGTYHKHYKESMYYGAWKYAINTVLFLDRNIDILEIGCGPGQFANMLLDNGFLNYKGFDYSEEAVNLAKQNNKNMEEKFWVADAFKEMEVESYHDLIICFEVLEHVQNDLEIIKRIKKGTKLLFSVPNFDDPYHVRFFNSEEEVQDRYKGLVDIYNIGVYKLNQVNKLFYILGQRK